MWKNSTERKGIRIQKGKSSKHVVRKHSRHNGNKRKRLQKKLTNVSLSV